MELDENYKIMIVWYNFYFVYVYFTLLENMKLLESKFRKCVNFIDNKYKVQSKINVIKNWIIN